MKNVDNSESTMNLSRSDYLHHLDVLRMEAMTEGLIAPSVNPKEVIPVLGKDLDDDDRSEIKLQRIDREIESIKAGSDLENYRKHFQNLLVELSQI